MLILKILPNYTKGETYKSEKKMTVFWVFDMVNGVVESLNVHSMNMCENMFVFCVVLTDPFGYLI